MSAINQALIDPAVLHARKIECEQDGLYFMRYFFKQRFGTKMKIGRHHPVIQAALDRTLLPPSHPDFISRLIINVPPGYTKTELASIHYMARGLAINPQARFLHLSRSDKLVLLNSGIVREIVKSKAFQDMWPIDIKSDTNSKHIWHTSVNGGVTATPAGGQVLGFRAGHMDEDIFTGALGIDDPVKPDEAYSELVREQVNTGFNETISSRLAIETVPIILIMQRIHGNDLSGYLLKGGSGEKWYHLNLPVIIDNSKPYSKKYTHGISIDHGLADGWLWPVKHSEKHRVALMSHRRKWMAQYLQEPLERDEDTILFTEAHMSAARNMLYYGDTVHPGPKDYTAARTVVAIDPATTDTEASDEHGIIVGTEWRHDFMDDARPRYTLDGDYSRKGKPEEWAETAITAYDLHDADAIIIETNQGGDMCESTLRNAGFEGLIIRVHAKKGKTLRAEPVAALYGLGFVGHAGGMSKTEDEMMDFDPITQKSNGQSPNRVDAAVYVMLELSGAESMDDLMKIALGDNA